MDVVNVIVEDMLEKRQVTYVKVRTEALTADILQNHEDVEANAARTLYRERPPPPTAAADDDYDDWDDIDPGEAEQAAKSPLLAIDDDNAWTVTSENIAACPYWQLRPLHELHCLTKNQALEAKVYPRDFFTGFFGTALERRAVAKVLCTMTLMAK